MLQTHPEIDDSAVDSSFGFLNFTAFRSGETPPRIVTTETGNEIEFIARHPSLDAADVSIVLAGGMLTIRGEKKASIAGDFGEPGFGAFARSFDVPAGARLSEVYAAIDGGVLAVRFPRPIDHSVDECAVRQAA